MTEEEMFLEAFKKAKIRCHIMTHESSKLPDFGTLVYLSAIQVWAESLIASHTDGSQKNLECSKRVFAHIRQLFDHRLRDYEP